MNKLKMGHGYSLTITWIIDFGATVTIWKGLKYITAFESIILSEFSPLTETLK